MTVLFCVYLDSHSVQSWRLSQFLKGKCVFCKFVFLQYPLRRTKNLAKVLPHIEKKLPLVFCSVELCRKSRILTHLKKDFVDWFLENKIRNLDLNLLLTIFPFFASSIVLLSTRNVLQSQAPNFSEFWSKILNSENWRK